MIDAEIAARREEYRRLIAGAGVVAEAFAAAFGAEIAEAYVADTGFLLTEASVLRYALHRLVAAVATELDAFDADKEQQAALKYAISVLGTGDRT